MNISMGKRSGIFDEKSMEVLVSTLFLIYVVKIPMEPLVILPWQYIKPIINLLDFYAIYLLFQPVRGYRIGTQIPTPGTVYRLDRIITWTALYSVKTKNMKIHDFRSIYQQNMKVGKFTVFTPFRNLRDCEEDACFWETLLDTVFKLPYYLSTPKIAKSTKIIKFSDLFGPDLSNFMHFVIFGVLR